MRNRRKNSRKSSRAHGFSSPIQRQLWGPVLRGCRVGRSEKRQALNEMSTIMAFGAGVALAAFGYWNFGLVGGLLGLVLGGGTMASWLARKRYAR